MNNFLKGFLLILVLNSILGCNTKTTSSNEEENVARSFMLINPTSQDHEAKTFEISPDFIIGKEENIDWEKISFSAVNDLPFQLVDEDQDGTPEKILILAALKANEKKEVSIRFSDKKTEQNFTKRTQAEISHKIDGEWNERKYIGGTFKNVNELPVPPEHTDHSEFIRYEGPGWESDKVGYRFYLDWRNAVDIFGKKTPDPVLQKVGLDGFDSYHDPADWGMDVLKVGGSLGIGSIGFWENGKATRIEKTDSLHCEILQNGNLQSKIRTKYLGWQINKQQLDLTSDLTIQAGSRMTRQDIAISASLPNICTGIVKHENGELLQKIPENKAQWGYIATYGKQSLAEDNLGMVIFFKGDNLIETREDEESHVVVLKPKEQHLTYYFAAAWEQESEGIKKLEEFKQYLENKAQELDASDMYISGY